MHKKIIVSFMVLAIIVAGGAILYNNLFEIKLKCLANNTNTIDELIVSTFDLVEFSAQKNKEYKIDPIFPKIYTSFIDDNLKLECVRNNQGHYYSVHRDKSGWLLFLFYSEDYKTAEWEAYEMPLCKDFSDQIIPGKSTLKDIEKIIGKTIVAQWSNTTRDISSSHLCNNGALLQVYYLNDKNQTVERIIKTAPNDNAFYIKLIDIDKQYLKNSK